MASASSFVCYECLQQNSTKSDLLKNGCDSPGEHGEYRKVKVWWWVEKGHLEVFYPEYPSSIPPIRPVLSVRRRYILCNYNSRCKKADCTYAHSIEERDTWNQNRTVKGPRSHQAATESRRMQEHHHPQRVTSGSRIAYCEPGLASNEPQAHHKTMSQCSEVVQQSVTRANYKQKFKELLDLEQQAHVKNLEKRCDGEYKLVLEQRGQRAYLSGLDGDQILYAAQASEGVEITVTSLGVTCIADILPENFHHTENKLYTEFHQEDRNIKKLQVGIPTSCHAKFILKYSYFNALQKSVAKLSLRVIQRLLPEAAAFRKEALSSVVNQRALDEQLDNCFPDQKKALKAIAHCHPNDPPFLITGPYGTGKTRLLAIASHYFFQEQRGSKPIRILVCTQQHVSADAFLECFNDLTTDRKNELNIVRLIPDHQRLSKLNPEIHRYFMKKEEYLSKITSDKRLKVLVITTCSFSLSLLHVASSIHHPGYFTHILIDEGAQMREPEAVAPLCLADESTRIVIAGDQHQVGPALLVEGENAQENGLAVSLLERLHALYHSEQLKEAARAHHSMLVTNHRCHEEIVKLSEFLFYDTDLTSAVPTTSTHPDAPYPLLFVCSSLDDNYQAVQIKPEEVKKEVKVVLEQMKKFLLHRWPTDGWGKKDFSQICFASPTRIQITLAEDLLKNSEEFPNSMKKTCQYVTYTIQGHEFRALFLSTAEPTWRDGTTRNPTKSICDRFVFNTVLSRARSLVVCVGNPFVLLRMEMHMQKKYGEKRKCWSNYLRLCIEHNTLSIDDSLEICAEEKQLSLEKLKLTIEKRLGRPLNQETSQNTIAGDSGRPASSSSIYSSATDSATGYSNTKDHEAIETSTVDTILPTRLEKEYKVLGHLGKGGFGLVLHVEQYFDKQQYAVKIIKLPNKQEDQDKVLREVHALALLNHHHIVRYHVSWCDQLPPGWTQLDLWKALKSTELTTYTPLHDQAPYSLSGSGSSPTAKNSSDEHLSPEEHFLTTVFPDEENVTTTLAEPPIENGNSSHAVNEPLTCLFIQTELCKEETLKIWLKKHIKDRPRKKILNYFIQILEAVAAIHRRGLVHRDLKPSNIFFSREEEDILKIGDFGLVVTAEQDVQSVQNAGDTDTVSSADTHTLDVGTQLYMSPEQLAGKKYNNKVDIFALGLIFIELNYPFATHQEKVKVLKEIQENVPTNFFKKLPLELLDSKPENRPTAEEVLNGEPLKLLKQINETRPDTEMAPIIMLNR